MNTDELLLNTVIDLSDESSNDSSWLESTGESSSDDEWMCIVNKDKRTRNCIQNYVELVVPQYSESEFKQHFRIRKPLYQSLIQKYKESEHYTAIAEQYNVKSPDKHIAVFLWFAGHEGCSYRDLADRFDLSLWTVHHIIYRITHYLSNLAKTVICWPSEIEQDKTAYYYLRKARFPGIIGCIDGTHIRIDKPKVASDDYIDRKGVVSISLQGICNEEKKFIDVFIGWPGSAHDSRVFKNSEIYTKLNTIRHGYYLLGDSAYPCLTHVMVPYRDNGHLTRSQKQFNRVLSSCRVDIEHSFGILKQRFRQLYYCKLRSMEVLCHFVRACCVLHNLSNYEEDKDWLNCDVMENPDDNNREHFENENVGKALRNQICNEMFPQPL